MAHSNKKKDKGKGRAPRTQTPPQQQAPRSKEESSSGQAEGSKKTGGFAPNNFHHPDEPRIGEASTSNLQDAPSTEKRVNPDVVDALGNALTQTKTELAKKQEKIRELERRVIELEELDNWHRQGRPRFIGRIYSTDNGAGAGAGSGEEEENDGGEEEGGEEEIANDKTAGAAPQQERMDVDDDHDEGFPCLLQACNSVFATEDLLQAHNLEKHQPKPRTKCTFNGCDKSYVRKGDLSRHILHKHPDWTEKDGTWTRRPVADQEPGPRPLAPLPKSASSGRSKKQPRASTSKGASTSQTAPPHVPARAPNDPSVRRRAVIEEPEDEDEDEPEPKRKRPRKQTSVYQPEANSDSDSDAPLKCQPATTEFPTKRISSKSMLHRIIPPTTPLESPSDSDSDSDSDAPLKSLSPPKQVLTKRPAPKSMLRRIMAPPEASSDRDSDSSSSDSDSDVPLQAQPKSQSPPLQVLIKRPSAILTKRPSPQPMRKRVIATATPSEASSDTDRSSSSTTSTTSSDSDSDADSDMDTVSDVPIRSPTDTEKVKNERAFRSPEKKKVKTERTSPSLELAAALPVKPVAERSLSVDYVRDEDMDPVETAAEPDTKLEEDPAFFLSAQQAKAKLDAEIATRSASKAESICQVCTCHTLLRKLCSNEEEKTREAAGYHLVPSSQKTTAVENGICTPEECAVKLRVCVLCKTSIITFFPDARFRLYHMRTLNNLKRIMAEIGWPRLNPQTHTVLKKLYSLAERMTAVNNRLKGLPSLEVAQHNGLDFKWLGTSNDQKITQMRDYWSSLSGSTDERMDTFGAALALVFVSPGSSLDLETSFRAYLGRLVDLKKLLGSILDDATMVHVVIARTMQGHFTCLHWRALAYTQTSQKSGKCPMRWNFTQITKEVAEAYKVWRKEHKATDSSEGQRVRDAIVNSFIAQEPSLQARYWVTDELEEEAYTGSRSTVVDQRPSLATIITPSAPVKASRRSI